MSDEDRQAVATYVLSLADVKQSLPLQGSVKIPANPQDQKIFDSNNDPNQLSTQKFALTAAYTDKGGSGIGAISGKKSIILKPARYFINGVVDLKSASKFVENGRHNDRDTIQLPATGGWLSVPLGNYDLTNIKALRIGSWVTKQNTSWQFELRSGSESGPLLGSGEIAAPAVDAYTRSEIKIQTRSGFENVFLLVRSSEKSSSELQLLDVSFHSL